MRTIKLCAATTHRQTSLMEAIHRLERDIERQPRVSRPIPAQKPPTRSH